MPASAGGDGEVSVEGPGGVNQDLLAFLVEGAHAADVAGEMATGDEFGQGGLGQSGRVAVDMGAQGADRVDQILGQHEVTHAQARKHHLAHGADIDNAGLGIEALQGG